MSLGRRVKKVAERGGKEGIKRKKREWKDRKEEEEKRSERREKVQGEEKRDEEKKRGRMFQCHVCKKNVPYLELDSLPL